ncbi:MAG: glycosyltransferase family 9 protein [Gammaproteobacteria bacterium]|nr:glycosyltransferase family 9 protein [Gammaproteobacteria bacterium]
MSSTLVIQPLPGIGDMVWHLPALTAIAALQPERRIDLLTKRRSHADGLLRGQTWLDRVLWLERGDEGLHSGMHGLLHLAGQLRAQAYRQVWLLHPSPRYGLLAALARIPQRYGYGMGLQRLFLNRGPFLRGARRLHPLARQSRYLDLLRRQGILKESAPDHPALAVAAGLEFPAQLGPAPLMAYGIGCSEADRRWPAERFAQLIQRSLDAFGGTHILLGSGADQVLVDSIRACLKPGDTDRLVVYLDRPLDQVVALLAGVDLFVGNDTGVMNIAAAVGCPTLGLFGRPISAVLAGYFPALTPIYPAREGMDAIEVAQVFDGMVAMLKERFAMRNESEIVE